MKTWRIWFMDGTEETVSGTSARASDGVLTIITDHQLGYLTNVHHFSMANVKMWKVVDR